jgi:hypothetical protein
VLRYASTTYRYFVPSSTGICRSSSGSPPVAARASVSHRLPVHTSSRNSRSLPSVFGENESVESSSSTPLGVVNSWYFSSPVANVPGPIVPENDSVSPDSTRETSFSAGFVSSSCPSSRNASTPFHGPRAG